MAVDCELMQCATVTETNCVPPQEAFPCRRCLQALHDRRVPVPCLTPAPLPVCRLAWSGVTDHFAQDEPHALAIARDIVASLNLPTPAGAGRGRGATARLVVISWEG